MCPELMRENIAIEIIIGTVLLGQALGSRKQCQKPHRGPTALII